MSYVPIADQPDVVNIHVITIIINGLKLDLHIFFTKIWIARHFFGGLKSTFAFLEQLHLFTCKVS